MRIPRVYVDQALCQGQVIVLSDNAAHYVSRVLRMGEGRPLILFNGQGGEYHGQIVSADKKAVSVELDTYNPDDRKSPLDIELAIGLSRGERWDFVLQKATELGVSRIVPLSTERTEVKLKGDRLEKKQQHWQQIGISACEQSQRNRLPEIAPLTNLLDYIGEAKGAAKFVLHHRDSQGLAAQPTPTSVSLLIGPEGGLSDEEITAARTAGFQPLTLGPRVLRTETAPIVAISLAQHLWGDL
ncbi:16S rRNA (uracil(1498)-N(3))-methyltransferase [Gilvimarinus sp. DA14]|uniref:16S rRNA (uracil(1498)-N(3))-methyltransferase n=1 Tax=Gilvimarinus sp. DA14 TaxID=2956798 RepID=UPI0020B6A7DD|nr:16S rRNA (uracil(1498)-N(3))-methyltransferase [Gilvimarinus sp. DA14]UTF59299.1 16S rRNA (uracil(1498)-N(3))-methyltransferase [Gilvimarinus sp. DA14]